MKINILVKIMICIITLFLIPLILADDGERVNYETAGVGRIVGGSPEEMLQHLQKEDLELDNAAFYADDEWFDNTEKKGQVIRSQFNNNEILESGWYWNDIFTNIQSDDRNKFLIFEAEGDLSGNDLIMKDSEGENMYANSLNQWGTLLKDSLLLLDVDFGGIFLPNSNYQSVRSIVGRLGDDNAIVTTTHVNSKEFVRSFICNMRNSRNLGETMRQARNNYYWGVNSINSLFSRREFIGLTMLSYLVYGNPLLNLDGINYEDYVLDINCPEYLHEFDYAGTTSVSITELVNDPLAAGSFSADFTRLITNERVVHDHGFEVLEISNTPQNYPEEGLALPSHLEAHEFPKEAIIRNVTLLEFDDLETYYLDDLPSMKNGSFVDRICDEDYQQPRVEYSKSTTENQEVVLVRIFPAEVSDCEDGEITLYNTIRYQINYIPRSPVVLKEITYERNVAPNGVNQAEISLQNVIAGPNYGTLLVKDENGNLLGQENTQLESGQIDTYTVNFNSPPQEGIHLLNLEYLENNEVKTKSDFIVRVNPVLLYFNNAPEQINLGDDLVFDYYIKNNHNSNEDYSLNINVHKAGNSIFSEGRNLQLALGAELNEQKTVATTNTETGFYDIEISVTGPGVNKTSRRTVLIANLNTQVAPELGPISDIIAYQGENIPLVLSARDENGDPLTFNLPLQFAGDLQWQTGIHDSGNYDLEVSVSDGYDVDTEEFRVTVNPKTIEHEFYDNPQLNNPINTKELIYNGPEEKTIYLKVLKKAQISYAHLEVSSTR